MPSQPASSPDPEGSGSSDDATTESGAPSIDSSAPAVGPSSHTVTPVTTPSSTPPPGSIAKTDSSTYQPTDTNIQNGPSQSPTKPTQSTQSPSDTSHSQQSAGGGGEAPQSTNAPQTTRSESPSDISTSRPPSTSTQSGTSQPPTTSTNNTNSKSIQSTQSPPDSSSSQPFSSGEAASSLTKLTTTTKSPPHPSPYGSSGGETPPGALPSSSTKSKQSPSSSSDVSSSSPYVPNSSKDAPSHPSVSTVPNLTTTMTNKQGPLAPLQSVAHPGGGKYGGGPHSTNNSWTNGGPQITSSAPNATPTSTCLMVADVCVPTSVPIPVVPTSLTDSVMSLFSSPNIHSTELSTIGTGKPTGTSPSTRPTIIHSHVFVPGRESIPHITTSVSSTSHSSSTTNNNNQPAKTAPPQSTYRPTPSNNQPPTSPSSPKDPSTLPKTKTKTNTDSSNPGRPSPPPKGTNPPDTSGPTQTTLLTTNITGVTSDPTHAPPIPTVKPTVPDPQKGQPSTGKNKSPDYTLHTPEVTPQGTSSQSTPTVKSITASSESEPTIFPDGSSTSNTQTLSTSPTASSSSVGNSRAQDDYLNATSSKTKSPQNVVKPSTAPPGLTDSKNPSSGAPQSTSSIESSTSPSTSSSGAQASSSKGNAALIGGIVGGIVGLILLAIIIYFILRRKKRQNLRDREASAPISPILDEEPITQFSPYNQLREPTVGAGYNIFYPDSGSSFVSIHRSYDQEMDNTLPSSDSISEPEILRPPSPFYPNDSTETIQAIPEFDDELPSPVHLEQNIEADESSGVPHTTPSPISFHPSAMATASSSAFYSARQTDSAADTFYATPRESMDSLSTLQPDVRVVEINPSTVSLVGFPAFSDVPPSSSTDNPFVVNELDEGENSAPPLHVRTISEQERDWAAALLAASPSPASSEGPSFASASKNPYYNYLKALKVKVQGAPGQPPSSWGMKNVSLFPATSRLSTASSALEVPDSESQCGIAM